MRPGLLLLFVIILINNGVMIKASSDVIVLTHDNFDPEVSDGSEWFLEFFAPWYSFL